MQVRPEPHLISYCRDYRDGTPAQQLAELRPAFVLAGGHQRRPVVASEVVRLTDRYVLALWNRSPVNIDYHVLVGVIDTEGVDRCRAHRLEAGPAKRVVLVHVVVAEHQPLGSGALPEPIDYGGVRPGLVAVISPSQMTVSSGPIARSRGSRLLPIGPPWRCRVASPAHLHW